MTAYMLLWLLTLSWLKWDLSDIQTATHWLEKPRCSGVLGSWNKLVFPLHQLGCSSQDAHSALQI